MGSTSSSARWLGMVLTAFGASGCSTTARAEIVVHATPATVWSVITDAEAYPEWNPVHVRAEGVFRDSGTVRIHLREPNGKVSAFESRVRRFEPHHLLNQGGGTTGIFTFDHTYRLEPVPEGTRVVQTEEFAGIGTAFVDMSWVQASYEDVNRALKRRAEALEERSSRRLD